MHSRRVRPLAFRQVSNKLVGDTIYCPVDVEMTYYQRIPSLVADSANWLLTAPTAYLYGCLQQYSIWDKDPGEGRRLSRADEQCPRWPELRRCQQPRRQHDPAGVACRRCSPCPALPTAPGSRMSTI